MVGVAQRLERWIVVPEVGGSRPLTHPKFFFEVLKKYHLRLPFLHGETLSLLTEHITNIIISHMPSHLTKVASVY